MRLAREVVVSVGGRLCTGVWYGRGVGIYTCDDEEVLFEAGKVRVDFVCRYVVSVVSGVCLCTPIKGMLMTMWLLVMHVVLVVCDVDGVVIVCECRQYGRGC